MNKKLIKQLMSELGKKSAKKRKGKTDYSALAKKRWDKAHLLSSGIIKL